MVEQKKESVQVDDDRRKKGNNFLVDYIENILDTSTGEVGSLRRKLRVTYWVVVTLSGIMFFLGLILVGVPAVSAFKVMWHMEPIELSEGLPQIISALLGLTDLAVLFMAKPVRQIHNLMGDMTQLTMAINNFRYQVGLRLLEMNIKDTSSIGKAAEKIDEAARSSMNLVESYFEKPEG